jgi:hypothetical protein
VQGARACRLLRKRKKGLRRRARAHGNSFAARLAKQGGRRQLVACRKPMTPAQLARHDQEHVLVHDSSGYGSNGCSPCEPADQTPDVEELGCALPPLPPPDLRTMRSEASGGISLVLCLIVTFVGLTIAFSSSGAKGMSELRLAVLGIVCAEAVVALGSLFMLMNGDPGVIRRNRDTAIPVPPEVVEKLQSALEASGQPHPLAGMANIEEDGRTYCVRCCLWRDTFVTPDRVGRWLGRRQPARARVHHCSTCQRCVRQFDHHVNSARSLEPAATSRSSGLPAASSPRSLVPTPHLRAAHPAVFGSTPRLPFLQCGVFGRCIAGRVLTWEGNMPYFVLLIVCGYAGFITMAASGVMALSGVFGGIAG